MPHCHSDFQVPTYTDSITVLQCWNFAILLQSFCTKWLKMVPFCTIFVKSAPNRRSAVGNSTTPEKLLIKKFQSQHTRNSCMRMGKTAPLPTIPNKTAFLSCVLHCINESRYRAIEYNKSKTLFYSRPFFLISWTKFTYSASWNSIVFLGCRQHSSLYWNQRNPIQSHRNHTYNNEPECVSWV